MEVKMQVGKTDNTEITTSVKNRQICHIIIKKNQGDRIIS
jgi:hypothetical protein